MRSFIPRVLIGGMILVVGLCHAVNAQDHSGKAEAQDTFDLKTATRITLGSSSGVPGTTVVVPLYFMPAQGVEVGRLKLDVDFLSAGLKFARIDPGIAAEMGNVDLSTELKEGKNEKGVDTSTLTITASLLSQGQSKKGIPAGMLSYLTLRISENCQPASIALSAKAEATALGTNKPIENLRAIDAKVDVLPPGSMPGGHH